MRIAVFGASGRVGTRLVEAILTDPGLELAAAHVSPGSPWIGRQVGNRLAITVDDLHVDLDDVGAGPERWRRLVLRRDDGRGGHGRT